MKPFQIPDWRQRQIRKKFIRQSKVTSRAVHEMEAILKLAVDRIIEAGIVSGKFFQPSLHAMTVVSDRFYAQVIQEAFYSCEDEKEAQIGKKKLAGSGRKGPKGIPNKLEDLADIFHDKKYFRQIMKRSRKMSDKLRKAYIKKLREKFSEVIPLIHAGEISPAEAKSEMMKTWKASRSRVETIFRTETTNYFSKVQTQFFQDDDGIIGMLFDANMDMATTDICHSRHGMIFRKEYTGKNSIAYNCPGCHFNCRSHYIPLANTSENRKLLEDESRDPRNHSLVPLPKGWRD